MDQATGEEAPTGIDGLVYFENPRAVTYHNAPEKTAEAWSPEGWATFGDVGHVDAEGFLYLTDRKANLIITGGVNVYPQEVENRLLEHPNVADAAVFGIPNADFGEEVKAAIEPAPGVAPSPELESELIRFCREELASFKCPRSVDFVETMPRHENGKLYKRLLRDRYWAGRSSALV